MNEKLIIRNPPARYCVPMRVLALALIGLPVAHAQETPFPTRTVQIVVPYTPGTGADILARTLGPRLAERWKINVITDNRAGATGNIGADFVAKAPPDGHTVLFTATSFSTTPALSARLPFDPVKSFAPVSLVATSSMSLVVHPQLPVKSLKDFIVLARREPGRLLYCSPGNGGPQHLAMELIKLETGIDLLHVPYKGSGGALTDLVGGHVQAMVAALQTVSPFVQNGRLRMLAIMGAERSPAFPAVPTLKEQGLANLEIEPWYGVLAPAATPASAITKINSELHALLQLPDIREQLARQGMNAAGGPPERLGNLVKSELTRWARVVSAAKIKAD
jgi:tripartite-type tricarboxylate transporter receptor subunit TctC